MINITEQLNYLATLAPKHLELYADGACKGNPGPGGWGVHFHEFDYPGLCGGDIMTTNNIQEMLAALVALQVVERLGCTANIYTDSNLVFKGLGEWLPGWKATNFKTVKKNRELWQQLIPLYDKLADKVTIHKVKGHSGNPGNDAADALANKGVKECLMKSKSV